MVNLFEILFNKEIITKIGGKVVELGDPLTDLILSQLSKIKLLKKLKVDKEMSIVDIRWVNECIAQNQILPPVMLLRNSPALKSKTIVPIKPEPNPIDTESTSEIDKEQETDIEKESNSSDRIVDNDFLIQQLTLVMNAYQGKDTWRFLSYRKVRFINIFFVKVFYKNFIKNL